MAKHRLIIVNPGHFHAALTLRERNPRIEDDVRVFSDDGPDLENFLRLVHAFNDRPSDPTHWTLYVHRGADYPEQLAAMRPGDVAVLAGKNNQKLPLIRFLHRLGIPVLADKPWLIEASQAGMLLEVLDRAPLCMDIMTERHEIANRLQKALARNTRLFGTFLDDGTRPAITLRSVHHLYKKVNGQPLRRPAWYFDTDVQGEGITDVTTHLVDLVQWMLADGNAFSIERDVRDLVARQWPTVIPLDIFSRITGLEKFPEGMDAQVESDGLHYRCNAAFSYRLRGIPVQIEALWDLEEPEGSGDLHHAVLRGTRSTLVVDQGPATNFQTTLTILPVAAGAEFELDLSEAVAGLQADFPGLGIESTPDGYRMRIPPGLRTTHEQHFASVLDEFLVAIEEGGPPENALADIACKYSLLAKAWEISHSGETKGSPAR